MIRPKFIEISLFFHFLLIYSILILETDHPIIFAKYFMFEAAKALHYGLTWQQAIRVVTMNPAKALDLSHRIGNSLFPFSTITILIHCLFSFFFINPADFLAIFLKNFFLSSCRIYRSRKRWRPCSLGSISITDRCSP